VRPDDLVLRREIRGAPREAAGEIEMPRERGRGQVRLPGAQRAVDLGGIVDHEEARLRLHLLREEHGEVVFEAGGKALRVLEVGGGAVHGENDELARRGDRRDRPGRLFTTRGQQREERQDCSTCRHGHEV
jgi:hypothetical protein